MIAAIGLVLIFLWLVRGLFLKPKNFPPGPPWKPFVGSSWAFKEALRKTGYQHLAFSLLAGKWKTNVLGLKLGGNLVVSVEDFDTIEHVLSSKQYDQRPTNFFAKLRNMGTNKGITFAQGHLWKEQRTFLARYISAIGNKSLDHNINCDVDTMQIDSGDDVNIMTVLRHTVFNILWSVVAGKRIRSETFEKNHLLDIISQRIKAFDMAGGILSQHPWLRFVVPERSGYNLICTLNREMKSFLMKTIEEHRQTWEKNIDSDFIYAYLNAIENGGVETSHYEDEQLFFVCVDLFIGGFSTTALTLGFIFLMMVLHQDVQIKIQTLLDENFDEYHVFEYQDRYKVPYLEAVIKEVQRFKSISPIFGPRMTICDTNLSGYTIPKGTTVLLNMYPTWMSKEIWGDPEQFRPERFLDKCGQFYCNPKFVPFGLGRRKCPADSFAQRSLFLITAKLLRQFKVLPADANNLPSMQPVPGMLLSPVPYLCRFEKR